MAASPDVLSVEDLVAYRHRRKLAEPIMSSASFNNERLQA
jgi:hypothetical protein